MAVTFSLDRKSNQKDQVRLIAATTQAKHPAAHPDWPLRFFFFFDFSCF
jgi:hypothetical protein